MEMNILLTSAGRRTYLVDYFREALKKAGLKGQVYAANSQESPALAAADGKVITPLIYSREYIPFLLEYCKDKGIRLLIPLFDIDLPVLAAYRRDFESAGTIVVTGEEEMVRLCNDKWEAGRYLSSLGVKAPLSWLRADSALEAVENKEVSWPLMVKPRWGMGSLSVYTAENEQELCLFAEKIRREIRCNYLKYEAAQDPEHCVLIQERLSGREMGMDVINDLEGRNRAVIVKEKRAMRSGETDEAVTEDNPALSALGALLGRSLKHRGNLDVDVFDCGGIYYVLELNARFGGGYPFSHSAGVDLPLALVLWAAGREAPEKILHARPGVRAWKDIRIQVENDL